MVYFQHVGGFTAKEAINLSFKEAIKDNLTTKFTWFGREESGLQPLYNTRIIIDRLNELTLSEVLS